MRRYCWLVMGSAVLLGCGGSSQYLKPVEQYGPDPCPGQAAASGEVEMQFLGVAGFKIRWRDEALLTDPFFSNPGLMALLFGGDVVTERGRQAAAALDLTDVKGIIVGQAHYDHLADVPLLIPRLPAGAKVWTSRTGKFLLQSAGVDPARVEELNPLAGNWRRPGEWVAIGRRFRVMALHSEHAPHLLGMKFLTGKLAAPLDHQPSAPRDWVEGQTFSFIIDLLEPAEDGGDRVAFRIHFQDSASNPPWGFHPFLDDGKRVDAALLCVASYRQVSDYPEAIVRDLRPRHVVLEHWDDFFGAPADPPRTVTGIDAEEFVTRLESALPADGAWVTPRHGAKLRFSVCPAPRD